MLGLAIPWLAIIACFLIGAIVNVIEGEKLNVLKPKVSEETLGGDRMNEPALICTGLTAAMLISLFCGSGLFLVFGFVLFWQILGALGDPDNPNKKSHRC